MVKMLLNCSVCGSSVDPSSIEYIRGFEIVCRSCYPLYYVKRCPVLRLRITGITHPSCNYCRFRWKCDEYIKDVRS